MLDVGTFDVYAVILSNYLDLKVIQELAQIVKILIVVQM